MNRLLPLVVLFVSACSGGALDSTEGVCDDFAAHARDGLPATDRGAVVQSIGEVIGNADQRLRDAYPPLQRTLTGSDSAYRLAADGFAQACSDSGWNG